MLRLLLAYSWPELRRYPWRNIVAALAVMLGVALAFAVHLINASALDEFSTAMRTVQGEPDVQVRSSGVLDETIYERVATHPLVAIASPVLELQTLATSPQGQRVPLRVVGADALVLPNIAPALSPRPAAGEGRLAVLGAGVVFLNPSARSLLPGASIEVRSGMGSSSLRIAGSVGAGGPPLAVMDIAAAQEFFGRVGQLTRIDVKLRPGATREQLETALQLPPGVFVAEPQQAARSVGELSRAYRVNLTVLALVALFTGSFLVYSVLALSVTRRTPQFALLGVLGLTASQRAWLVVAEASLVGLAGTLAGLAAGTGLARLALETMGGDLGGGYFVGVEPTLRWSAVAAAAYGLAGVAAAVAGAWMPALTAARLPLAQALKGVGTGSTIRFAPGLALLMLVTGAALALLPPVNGIPVAAYLSVALILLGGIVGLPSMIRALYGRIVRRLAAHPLPLLAVERARRVPETAAVAIGGVVAALSLAVALTVMVASFRDSMVQWLSVLLPADLYVRAAPTAAAGESIFFTPQVADQIGRIPGVARLQTQRVRSIALDPARPSVVVLARPVGDAQRTLPLVEGPMAVASGATAVFVSEAMVDLYGARMGEPLPSLAPALGISGRERFVVAGVWRDYVRQSGAIVIDQQAYVRLTGDRHFNEVHLWLTPEGRADQVQDALRQAVVRTGGVADFEIASAAQLRATSLRLFDRSFAVTYWLQAVAIAIGLFGIAASFSAQVLARRREFGLLSHLGLTRRQILTVVAGEGAAWTVVGALAGTVLGLLVAVVLVKVVNPQSFHWSMDLSLPAARLAWLAVAVVAAGTGTAWLAGRAAASRQAVMAVKEDW